MKKQKNEWVQAIKQALPLDANYYVGTPYSLYPGGINLAFRRTSINCSALVKAGFSIFSPIVHSHPLAIAGKIDPLDAEFWLSKQLPFMKWCDALLIIKMLDWDKSKGIKQEIEIFDNLYKPVIYIDPPVIA